jgi:hypothetical protein
MKKITAVFFYQIVCGCRTKVIKGLQNPSREKERLAKLRRRRKH